MKGVVFYTDGGCQGNPGPTGSGIHGYIFEYAKPKRGTGSKDVVTNKGYVTKELFKKICKDKEHEKESLQKTWETIDDLPPEDGFEKIEQTSLPFEVQPVKYINAHFGYSQYRTNNYGELNAAIRAFKFVLDEKDTYDFKKVLIIGDSNYVIIGASNYLAKWAENRFRKSDGSAIVNEELWREMHMLLAQLKEAGIKVEFKWVKGHNGDTGNEKADSLATVGVNVSINKCLVDGKDYCKVNVEDPEGFWKKDVECPVMLYNTHLVFTTNDAKVKGTYLTYSTSQPLKFLGSKQSDAGFAMVELFDTDERAMHGKRIIDDFIKAQSQALGDVTMMATLDLPVLFSKGVTDIYNEAGHLGISQDNKDQRHEFYTNNAQSKRVNISNVIYPPYLSFKILDVTKMMDNVLSNVDAGIAGSNKQDITNLFYETVSGKKGDTAQLLSKYKVGYKVEEIDAEYFSIVHGKIATCNLRLVLGQDLPDRNTLKRLELHNPKVYLYTWSDNGSSFQYGVYLECDLGRMFCCSSYSNTRLLTLDDVEKAKG